MRRGEEINTQDVSVGQTLESDSSVPGQGVMLINNKPHFLNMGQCLSH